MVTQLGFCSELGQVSWSGGGGGMMASQMGQPPETSMATADKIDNEVGVWVQVQVVRLRDDR
jgi:ATP-dependent Zn protease